MVLGVLMIWEGVRWLLIEVINEWTPGSQQRKLRRLRRLQQATTEAIERELERLQQSGTREGPGDPERRLGNHMGDPSKYWARNLPRNRRLRQGDVWSQKIAMQDADGSKRASGLRVPL